MQSSTLAKIPTPAATLNQAQPTLRFKHLSHHNLSDISLEIACGQITCVVGVSGSGKSSLIEAVISSLTRQLHGETAAGSNSPNVESIGSIEDVVDATGSIGRWGFRSTVFTALDLVNPIGELYSLVPSARAVALRPEYFSYNHRKGRCEACRGRGLVAIAKNRSAKRWVTCPSCAGSRYSRTVLSIHYRGLNIVDVLGLTADDALDLFQVVPRISRVLRMVSEFGLGYLRLGESMQRLSIGEQQRVFLVRRLLRRRGRRAVYFFDEPTRGLGLHEIELFQRLLRTLVTTGGTVVAIEHNVSFMNLSDQLIELGPGAGPAGGRIVAQGAPHAIARNPDSIIGRYLTNGEG